MTRAMMMRRAIRAMAAAVTVVVAAGLVLAASGHAATGASAYPPAAQRGAGPWVGTWAASPQKPAQDGFDDVTLRLIVHTTIGGNHVRIRIANTFGTTPLQIGAASVGVQASGAAVQPGTLRPLLFSGRPSVTIGAGGQIASDGVAERLPAAASLAVSLYLPVQTGPPTEHADFGNAHQTSYLSAAGAGDFTGDATAAGFPDTTTSWFFLDGVDVRSPGAGAVVTLGDSITDGTNSSTDTNHRYPNWLADRLAAAGGPYAKLSVLNAGIGGNELLQTSACCGASPSALARLNTDVLGQPGVRDVIVLLGTNDILGAHQASAAAIIAGFRQLIRRVHARGVKIFGATITPSNNFTAAEQQIRETVNQWITTSGAFDGVFDFADAVADPASPQQLSLVYDSGGGLHPNDTGYHAMADAVDLNALLPGRPPRGTQYCLTDATLQAIRPGSGVGITCRPPATSYTYDDTSPQVTYTGTWTHASPSNATYTPGDYEQTESWSSEAGASVSVTFTGTGIEVAGPLDTNAGIAGIYVDGALAGQADTYDPFGKWFQSDVFTVQGLAPGTHTLTVVVTGTKNPASAGTGIVVDAFDVNPDLALPARSQHGASLVRVSCMPHPRRALARACLSVRRGTFGQLRNRLPNTEYCLAVHLAQGVWKAGDW